MQQPKTTALEHGPDNWEHPSDQGQPTVKIPGKKKERKLPSCIALNWGELKAIQQRQHGVVWSGLTEHTLKIFELFFCRAAAIPVAGSTAQFPRRASWHYCVTQGCGITACLGGHSGYLSWEVSLALVEQICPCWLKMWMQRGVWSQGFSVMHP